MKTTVNGILYWTPRVLCLLFAAFLSIFAFDVFGRGYGLWKTALALVMHLIPTALVLAVLAIAWRREWLGALLFLGLGFWYALTTLNHPSWILGIALPAFLIGGLFLLNWLWLKGPRASAPPP